MPRTETLKRRNEHDYPTPPKRKRTEGGIPTKKIEEKEPIPMFERSKEYPYTEKIHACLLGYILAGRLDDYEKLKKMLQSEIQLPAIYIHKAVATHKNSILHDTIAVLKMLNCRIEPSRKIKKCVNAR